MRNPTSLFESNVEKKSFLPGNNLITIHNERTETITKEELKKRILATVLGEFLNEEFAASQQLIKSSDLKLNNILELLNVILPKTNLMTKLDNALSEFIDLNNKTHLTVEQKLDNISESIEKLSSPKPSFFSGLYNYGKFFSAPSGVTKATIAATVVIMGIFLYICEEQLLNNKYKGFAAFFIIFGLGYLLSYVFQGTSFAAEKITVLTNQVIEITRETKNIIKESGSTIKTAAEVVKLLGETSNKVMVELLDINKNAVVQLVGEAKEVAKKIRDGIDKDRFKPTCEANVNMQTEIHVNKLSVSAISL